MLQHLNTVATTIPVKYIKQLKQEINTFVSIGGDKIENVMFSTFGPFLILSVLRHDSIVYCHYAPFVETRERGQITLFE